MKLLNLSCPNCGAKMSVNKDTNECICSSCGGTFLLDDESTTHYVDINGAEEAGYQFEKGRQKAQAEMRTTPAYAHANNASKRRPPKRRTWLWVLGWLFIFPIPVTILVYRSKKLDDKTKLIIIASVWAVFLLIGLLNRGSNTESYNYSEPTVTSNIQTISFSRSRDVEMTVGDSPISGYVSVNARKQSDFSPSDIIFVSENPDVATIVYTYDRYNAWIYYDISPVSEGETYVYAMSADGAISSEQVRVIVNGIIEVESISINEDYSLLLGESVCIYPVLSPEDAADRSVTWTSSDESVVTVDDEGTIIGVGSGEAVITGTTGNGLSDTCNVTVDDSQRVFNLSITRTRDDSNNIGDEWSHTRQINGEQASNGTYAVAIGDTLTFYVRASEDDDVPDVGESTVTHTVTEDDFNNGFSVVVEVYATENGGRNSGQSAHFITTFSFEIQ